MTTADDYQSWYTTPRGRWIADAEFALLLELLRPPSGASVLDVGGGTGQFSRALAARQLAVVNMEPDRSMVDVARRLSADIPAVQGDARTLPFGDATFDYAVAVTSLCFIEPPAQALSEMWWVSRRAVFLGLLNRHSLLYRNKRGRGGYRDARWDTRRDVEAWAGALHSRPAIRYASGILLPDGRWLARRLERLLPSALPWGGFLAAALWRPSVH